MKNLKLSRLGIILSLVITAAVGIILISTIKISLENRADTDVQEIEAGNLDVTKSIASLVQEDEWYFITYRIRVTNPNSQTVSSLNVTDSLSVVFAPHPFFIESLSNSTLPVNSAYNGVSDINLVTAGSSLAPGQSTVFELQIRFNPQGSTGPFENEAYAYGVLPGPSAGSSTGSSSGGSSGRDSSSGTSGSSTGGTSSTGALTGTGTSVGGDSSGSTTGEPSATGGDVSTGTSGNGTTGGTTGAPSGSTSGSGSTTGSSGSTSGSTGSSGSTTTTGSSTTGTSSGSGTGSSTITSGSASVIFTINPDSAPSQPSVTDNVDNIIERSSSSSLARLPNTGIELTPTTLIGFSILAVLFQIHIVPFLIRR